MKQFLKRAKEFWLKYNYCLVCLLCLFICVSAIWLKDFAIIFYFVAVLIASFFYDVNKMLPLCSISVFFLSLLSFYTEILVFFISLSIIFVKKIVNKEIKFTKEWLIPGVVIAILSLMFFTINFNYRLIKYYARTILAVAILFGCFLLRKDFNVLKITKNLVVLFTVSCFVSLFFMLPGSSVNVIYVETLGIKRYMGLMTHPNVVGVLAVLLMGLLLQFYIKREINNIQFIVYCLPMVLTGICTKGKLFLLLSFVIGLIYFVFLFKRNKKLCLIECCVLLVGLLTFNICFNNYLTQIIVRFTGYFTESSLFDQITTGRISLWKTSLHLWSFSVFTILLGVGGSAELNNFNAHNELIEILTRYGVVGLFLVCLVIGYICYKLRKFSTFNILNYFAFFIGILTMMVDPFIHEKFVFFALCMMTIYDGAKEKDSVDGNQMLLKLKNERNNILVSVIVPIYKVEPYLVRCLESIIHQTYEKLEIILVDDGSPDNCPVICDEYAKKDKRIRVIHKQNGGLMDAWMTGLQNSKGDYISFVDSDDWCELNMIEKLMEPVFEHNAGLVIGNYFNAFKNYKVMLEGNKGEITGFLDGDKLKEFQQQCIAKPNSFIPLFRWNKLYQKSLLMENLKYCDKRITFYEDVCVVQACILKARNISFIEDYIYNYFFRDNSMIHKYKDNIITQFELYFRKYTEMIKEITQNDNDNGLTFENLRLVYSLGKTILYSKIKNKNRLLKDICACNFVKKLDLEVAKEKLSVDRYLLAKAYKKGNIFAIKMLYFMRDILVKLAFLKNGLKHKVIEVQ